MSLWSLTGAVGRDEHSDLLPAIIRECKSDSKNESRGVTKYLRNDLSWLFPKKFSWDFRLINLSLSILHNGFRFY